jgi:hypothetical protein
VNADAVASTLSKLRSECQLCGDWSLFTGRTAMRGTDRFIIVRCPNGHGDFEVWNRDFEPLVEAVERAKQRAQDPAAYERAFTTLTGGDPAAIAALLAARPPELPLFAVENVALPRELITRWCELVLDGALWSPEPARAVRVEEALATAVHYNEPACVDVIGARVTDAELAAVAPRLERRFDDHSIVRSLLERSRA